jgi:23S rRNA pseudouridine2605 synthase
MPNTTLLKALMAAGADSRRSLADRIINGGVRVNGRPVEDLKYPVDTGKDRVTVDGREVDLRPKEVIYLMLNKPKDVLSTTGDGRGRRTVTDLLPEEYRGAGLYAAGRLDKDTTGLMLLTNDGNLTYRLTHPKYEHEKEYLVHIEGKLTTAERNRLENGIKLEEGMTSTARIRDVTSEHPYNYSLTIHEGKKRQVRRMFERLKHPVIDLKRVRIGGLRLGNLKEGKVRRLGAHEITALTKR